MNKKTLSIELFGYGGEVVMGKVNDGVADFFDEHEIDISQYATDDEFEFEIPENLIPFPPGCWFECDNLAHNNNVEMNEQCTIEVRGDDDEIVWESDLATKSLKKKGCVVDESQKINIEDQTSGVNIFYGQTLEKGNFFTGTIELDGDFDRKKLKFVTIETNGWVTLKSLEYDGIEIENTFDVSSTGKDSMYEFYVAD